MKRAKAGSPQAWQPLTPPGVAAFAAAPLGRLFAVQLIFGTLAGIATAVFLASTWFPTLGKAIANLPEVGYIRGGRLAWAGDSPVELARSPWLALTVNLHEEEAIHLPSDVQVEFSADTLRILSLSAYVDLPYPRGWIIVFNEPELGAWWSAWKPFLGIGAGLLTVLGLLILWSVLAALYALPAGLVCRFVEHGITYGAVWKLCGAAQLPGCLLGSFALLLYSLRAIDLLQWLFLAGAQFVLGWVYLFLATFFLPGQTRRSSSRSNPFAPK